MLFACCRPRCVLPYAPARPASPAHTPALHPASAPRPHPRRYPRPTHAFRTCTPTDDAKEREYKRRKDEPEVKRNIDRLYKAAQRKAAKASRQSVRQGAPTARGLPEQRLEVLSGLVAAEGRAEAAAWRREEDVLRNGVPAGHQVVLPDLRRGRPGAHLCAVDRRILLRRPRNRRRRGWARAH